MDFPGAAISTFSCHYLPLSLCSLPCFLASLVSLFVPELRLFLLLLPRVHLHLELRLPRRLMFESSRQSYTLSLKSVCNVMLFSFPLLLHYMWLQMALASTQRDLQTHAAQLQARFFLCVFCTMLIDHANRTCAFQQKCVPAVKHLMLMLRDVFSL
jgi:hypothetical protein